MKIQIASIILILSSVKIHAQSQIYGTTYGDCVKQQFDSGLVDLMIYNYDVGLKIELRNLTSVLSEEEKKPILNQLNELDKLVKNYLSYLKSIPKLYPIEDKQMKKDICSIWIEGSNIRKKVDLIQEYCSKIYIEKEKKNYSKERLSR